MLTRLQEEVKYFFPRKNLQVLRKLSLEFKLSKK